MMAFDVLIVGAGHAGAQAAITLRHLKFDGSVGIIGDEPDFPYERPPLSKDYLASDREFERILIRPASFWRERDVEIMLSKRVVSVDALAHHVTLSDGSKVSYGKLIWAAGGKPRALTCAGADASGVFSVRRRDDVDAIKAALPRTQDIVIIGGGYIGLEAASVMSKFGKNVTLLEAFDRVLARVAGVELSTFYEAEHRAHGIDLRTETRLDSIEVTDGRATGVKLADGEVIPADMVIVGIGIVPEVEPLIEAGASGSNGLDIDGYCRTSLVDVYAVGDCASHANKYYGGMQIRLESVQNANDQAKLAVQHIMGLASAQYDALPWFWSNQYDLKLQTVGLSSGYDETVLRGDPATRSFSVAYFKEGRVIALDCVNAVKDYAQGRALVLSGAKVKKSDLSDISISLKDIQMAYEQSSLV